MKEILTEIAIIGAGSAGLSTMIEVDGGVNLETGKRLVDAGADVLVIDENKLPGGQLLELGL